MHNIILILFAVSFSGGLYLLGAELLHIPSYRATRVIWGAARKNRRQARNSDAFIMELAIKLAKYLPMDEYKKRKLNTVLKATDIALTAEVYRTQAMIKAGLVFLGVIPAVLIWPLMAPAFVVAGIAVYLKESTSAETQIRERRKEIEYELPRFVATLTQQIKASRDVLNILETYQKQAGMIVKQELEITTADMRTGNYEGALTRLEGRVSSAMLSDVVRGLIGVLRGDDGVVFFSMLSHDMKQIELQRLKKLALERPPRIRKYSMLLLGCMLLLYLGVMGYQILGTMLGLF